MGQVKIVLHATLACSPRLTAGVNSVLHITTLMALGPVSSVLAPRRLIHVLSSSGGTIFPVILASQVLVSQRLVSLVVKFFGLISEVN